MYVPYMYVLYGVAWGLGSGGWGLDHGDFLITFLWPGETHGIFSYQVSQKPMAAVLNVGFS